MKKILLLFGVMILTSCVDGNTVKIEEIKAYKEIKIEKEKTTQLELQLEIEKEKNKK
jgi:hypothetical protein